MTAGRRRCDKGESLVSWPEVCERAAGLIALWGGEASLLAGELEPPPELIGDLQATRSAIALYALLARHRRADEVPREARLRARARRCGMPLVAAHRGALSLARAPPAAGRAHLHPPRRHARDRRPPASAATTSTSSSAPHAFAHAVRRRARRGRAHARDRRALHVLARRAALSLSVGAAARRHRRRRSTCASSTFDGARVALRRRASRPTSARSSTPSSR